MSLSFTWKPLRGLMGAKIVAGSAATGVTAKAASVAITAVSGVGLKRMVMVALQVGDAGVYWFGPGPSPLACGGSQKPPGDDDSSRRVLVRCGRVRIVLRAARAV